MPVAGLKQPADASRCVSCGMPLDGPFCSRCGEKRLEPHDRTLRHFAEQTLATFTHADSRIFRTLRTVITQPGALTAAYMAGRRKPYVGPLQFFLIANVAFFVVHSLIGWNTFTTPLIVHEYQMPYSAFARTLVSQHLAGTGMSHEDYGKVFDAKISLHAKTLVIIMVPIFAFVVAGLWSRRGRYFVEHLVFSLHFYTFFLLLISAINSLIRITLFSADLLHRPISESRFNYPAALVMLFAALVYLALAIRRVYGDRPVWLAAKALGLTLAVAVNVQLYRFILFLVTLATT